MANFEGDLTGLSEKQLNFIENVIEKRGYVNPKVTVQPLGRAGDNYIAIVKRITVEENGETLKIVAKVAPVIEDLRNTMQTKEVFYNEHVVYTELLPKFTELEVEAEIPKKERLRYAACLGSLDEEPNEIILLEDLQEPGFTLLDRFKALQNDQMKLIIENIAKLHALSFALKNKELETFDKIRNKLYNSRLHMGKEPTTKHFLNHIENQFLDLLDEEKYKQAIKGKISGMDGLMGKLHKADKDSKHLVIQQGDCWTNNVLFRLQDENVVECCMIDYQFACANLPVDDVYQVLFNCSDYDSRAKHFQEWLDYYHMYFTKYLYHFGLKADNVYSKEQFESDMIRYGKFALGQAAFSSSFLLKNDEDAEKMKSAMDSGITELTDEMLKELTSSGSSSMVKLKTRLEELVDSFIELGYL
uniref:CHK kinase-like domain-containing protein n=1 Tax=Pectinophora gossypiella TaxID=13191 RepID=A0A1E1WL08_PECGO